MLRKFVDYPERCWNTVRPSYVGWVSVVFLFFQFKKVVFDGSAPTRLVPTMLNAVFI